MIKRLTLPIKSNNYVPDMKSWVAKHDLNIKVGRVVVDPATFEPTVTVFLDEGVDTTAFMLKWGGV